MRKELVIACSLFFIGLLLSSCISNENTIPKPVGYHRAYFPAKDTITIPFPNSPFSFTAPTYSKFAPAPGNKPGTWLWVFPDFKAEVFLSYHPVANNFAGLVEDAFTLVNRHQVKASNIESKRFSFAENKTAGLTFNIEGPVASQFQFFISDSTQHFLRGELYFFCEPNPDSLQPSIDFIEEDIELMLASLKWK